MRIVSHRFMYLNSWSPVGGSVWESHGTFRRRSLGEGSALLQVGFEGL